MSENNVGKFNLTFIRHGETDLNLKGVLQGHVDAELNDTGKQQAIGIGRHLQNESFSHVYSSDLSRAFQTCVHTLQQNKHAVSQVESQNELNRVEDLITVNAMLRERKFGCMEGKHWHELYRAERQSDVNEGEDFVPEGAESVNDVRIRAKGFFINLCKTIYEETNSKLNQESCPNILVVSHGGYIRVTLKLFFDDFGCSVPNHILNSFMNNCAKSSFVVTLPTSTDSSDPFTGSSPTENWHEGITVKCTVYNETA